VTVTMETAEETGARFLWLDVTRKCQLNCTYCYNSSGPDGGHGTMTRQDWTGVLDQAAACGVDTVQFIGGEPTMHPDAAALVEHALGLGLKVEVFSNLVHVPGVWWELFQHDGVRVATSYYSAQAAEHNAVTGRPSHARTRANLAKAVGLGIPLRVGIIAGDEQRADEARRELEALGVTDIRVDHVRPFGRGAAGRAPDVSGLCGRCGTGKAAIGPDGQVSPCVFSAWMGVGNVQDAPLAAILGGTAMAEANASIRSAARSSHDCDPDGECSPGSPGSGCSPRT
jgi:MoaA/NifB/PqqE/SkfB family radical SAM enzyme